MTRCCWAILLLLGCLGCGYTLGYRMPAGVHSLRVPLFENETFPLRREVGIDLTRAVRRELSVRSGVRIVSGEDADAVLRGTVLSFREGVLVEGARDVVQESSIEIQVRVRLERSSDGSAILEETISDSEAFSNLRGESIADARQAAIARISQRIVATLEAW